MDLLRGAICQATMLSAIGSLALAPFSVYFGGKLIGVPYTLLNT